MGFGILSWYAIWVMEKDSLGLNWYRQFDTIDQRHATKVNESVGTLK